ncbi:MAG: hypothetical protein ACTHZ7_14800 [Sphingobacterium sp.]
MEKIGKENQQILLDLVAINQDRVEGYRAAIGILDKRSDADVIAKLENYMQQAQQFKTELIALAFHAETRRPNETEFSRMPWSITQQPSGTPCPSRESLIDICIKEETECQEVYRISLKNLEQIEESVTQIIKAQHEAQASVLEGLHAIRNPNSTTDQENS